MGQLLKVAVIVGFSSGVVAQAPKELSLQQLYKRHSWFELRDAIAGRIVPSIYAGAVASAFNRTRDAEKYLNRAAREASTTEAANEAREVLVSLYARLGRSSDMIRVLDDILAAAPARSDVRNVRDAFESFRRLPNQAARTGRRRPFPCTVSAAGVILPVVVNGKAVEWLLDTGFSHSALSESEARMLGISVRGASVTAQDFAGGATAVRTAVAERVAIGDAELRNVPVLVFPDSQPPWNEQPPGKRGTIGLPVAVALQAITWTKDGTCQMGSNPITATADVNLAFDGETPLTRVQFSGKPLELVLDTGNQGGTQLWERFARDFPDVVGEGSKSTKRVHQIGGSVDRQIVVIPEIRLRVGGFNSVLRPANVFSKPIGNDSQHGNLGMDVLSQAAEVMIDFQAMSLTLR
jgi:hypothetical protein